MEQYSGGLDTLLHYPQPISAITPDTNGNSIKCDGHTTANNQLPGGGQSVYKWRDKGTERQRGPSGKSLLVKGSDVGDLPTEYMIHGLHPDELPTIGTYVHPSITPGFRYRVRLLGNNSRYIFSDDILYLQSVGRGYGKRITFESASQIYNPNYFYSDSNEKGYGFTIVALQAGDNFIICDQEGYAVGQGTVREISFQKEAHCLVESDGSLIKNVNVSFTCEVKYGASQHGLMPLCVLETLQLRGTALVIKLKGSKKAFTKSINNIMLPNYGRCDLTMAPGNARVCDAQLFPGSDARDSVPRNV